MTENLEGKIGVEEVFIPEVYRLIASGASSIKIVEQLFKDFYSPRSNKEAVCLALEELLGRTLEAKPILSFIAKDNGQLGELAKEISSLYDGTKTFSTRELERIFGINRRGEVLRIPSFESSSSFLNIYRAAIGKKLIDEAMSLEDFVIMYNSACVFARKFPPQLSGAVEKEIVAMSSTFGTDTPAYLELLGPKEILKMRSIKGPEGLLLGSLGICSGLEFAKFFKKINPTAVPNVLELADFTVSRLKEHEGSTGIKACQGNVMEMPYPDGSMDYCFSNYLLHSLIVDNKIDPNKNAIKKMLKEAHRVLKPGGKFFMVERAYGNYKKVPNFYEMKNEVVHLAKQADFSLPPKWLGHGFTYTYAFRCDIGTEEISTNGFADYRKACLLESEPNAFAIYFQRE